MSIAPRMCFDGVACAHGCDALECRRAGKEPASQYDKKQSEAFAKDCPVSGRKCFDCVGQNCVKRDVFGEQPAYGNAAGAPSAPPESYTAQSAGTTRTDYDKAILGHLIVKLRRYSDDAALPKDLQIALSDAAALLESAPSSPEGTREETLRTALRAIAQGGHKETGEMTASADTLRHIASRALADTTD